MISQLKNSENIFMKTFLLLLVLLAFLQSAFLPLNLVLVLLIARSLVVEDRSNLILAFGSGLVLSFLTQVNLGYWPVILILAVKLAGMIRKLPVSFNPVIIILSGVVVISIVAVVNNFFIGETIQLFQRILESVLVLPAFYLTRAWEERFVVKSAIKLKMKSGRF